MGDSLCVERGDETAMRPAEPLFSPVFHNSLPNVLQRFRVAVLILFHSPAQCSVPLPVGDSAV